MSKRRTNGKRYLKDDVWHDDDGEIPGTPASWDPPMTEAEIIEAALSDPDNPPLTAAQLSRMRRISRAKFIRRKLGLSQEQFSERFHIPLGTLRDWEQHRAEPDQAAKNYLVLIEHDPGFVDKALGKSAA